jgi:hypothetical protein
VAENSIIWPSDFVFSQEALTFEAYYSENMRITGNMTVNTNPLFS